MQGQYFENYLQQALRAGKEGRLDFFSAVTAVTPWTIYTERDIEFQEEDLIEHSEYNSYRIKEVEMKDEMKEEELIIDNNIEDSHIIVLD